MNRHAPGRRLRAEGGSVSVTILFLVLLLEGLALGTLQEGLGQQTALTHYETSLRALEIAEAGLVHSDLEIRAQRDPDGDGIGSVRGEYGGGRYEVRAAHDVTNPDHYTLTAIGTHGLSVRRLEVRVRRVPRMPFLHSLFAKNDVKIKGSVQTDSFDSRLGTWGEQAVNTDDAGDYADGGGDVGANGDISLGGSSPTIRGDARPGPLGEVTTEGTPTVWGSTEPREEVLGVPDVPLETFVAAWKSNDNEQLLICPGYDPVTFSLLPAGHDKVRLKGGTYFFTDVRFEGSTQLLVQGRCRVYVTGNLHLSGGTLVNQTGKSENLLVFVHAYSVPPGFTWTPIKSKGKWLPQIVLTGGSDSALSVYAPAVEVLLTGNAALFGAVVGSAISVEGNPAFHYDRALGHIEWPGQRRTERIYWIDRALPPR